MRFVEIKIIPKMKKLFTLLLMVLISGLYAQTTGSSIEGKLTDQNGDPLTGATILATHRPTGTTFYATSLDGGFFNITNVIPGGPYTLVISEMESKDTTIEDIEIDLGETFLVNVSLSK